MSAAVVTVNILPLAEKPNNVEKVALKSLVIMHITTMSDYNYPNIMVIKRYEFMQCLYISVRNLIVNYARHRSPNNIKMSYVCKQH